MTTLEGSWSSKEWRRVIFKTLTYCATTKDISPSFYCTSLQPLPQGFTSMAVGHYCYIVRGEENLKTSDGVSWKPSQAVVPSKDGLLKRYYYGTVDEAKLTRQVVWVVEHPEWIFIDCRRNKGAVVSLKHVISPPHMEFEQLITRALSSNAPWRPAVPFVTGPGAPQNKKQSTSKAPSTKSSAKATKVDSGSYYSKRKAVPDPAGSTNAKRVQENYFEQEDAELMAFMSDPVKVSGYDPSDASNSNFKRPAGTHHTQMPPAVNASHLVNNGKMFLQPLFPGRTDGKSPRPFSPPTLRDQTGAAFTSQSAGVRPESPFALSSGSSSSAASNSHLVGIKRPVSPLELPNSWALLPMDLVTTGFRSTTPTTFRPMTPSNPGPDGELPIVQAALDQGFDPDNYGN